MVYFASFSVFALELHSSFNGKGSVEQGLFPANRHCRLLFLQLLSCVQFFLGDKENYGPTCFSLAFCCKERSAPFYYKN